MKSLEELRSLRQRMENQAVVPGEKKQRITVAMGTCGIAAGARDVLLSIMAELATRNIADVTVAQTSCIGMCEKEPLVEVSTGSKTTLYAYVNGERARQIVLSHLINGDIVTEWSVERS